MRLRCTAGSLAGIGSDTRSVAGRAVHWLAIDWPPAGGAGYGRAAQTGAGTAGRTADGQRGASKVGQPDRMAEGSRQEADMLTVSVQARLCRRCVRAVSRLVRDVPGVVSFEVDAARGLLLVQGDVDERELVKALGSAVCLADAPCSGCSGKGCAAEIP
ncbi:heavy-metal-associated domain-containing protein [Sphaerimonospora cavernae]|uniref:Heavy-metal-associated domain-containing protein n=1 Tax=Sphaerimonospora cavernae TaxID=1740611 RepID=A0ABV6U6K5_9ACTN